MSAKNIVFLSVTRLIEQLAPGRTKELKQSPSPKPPKGIDVKIRGPKNRSVSRGQGLQTTEIELEYLQGTNEISLCQASQL